LRVVPFIDVCHHRSLPSQPKGKKRTAEEIYQTAEANDWVEGAHEEEDRVVLKQDGPSDRYKSNQKEALNQWVM
jgi:hypothetical protein